MDDYTVRDHENYGEMDVAKRAYPKFLEKLEVCQNLFYGFDYSSFYNGTDLQRGKIITGAVNFIMAVEKEEQKQAFIKEALMLKQSLSLCSSMVKEQMRMEAAFFESVRVLVMRLLYNPTGKKFSLKEINERVNELLKQSVKSDGVLNLFSDIGEKVNLFDTAFLENISKLKEKNLAVEMLKKLIAEQVKVFKRTNLVKSEKFSVLVQEALNRYLNGMLTNEEVIQELLTLAKEMLHASEEGNLLGLNDEELAFYDALTKPEAVRDFYTNEELVALTKELTETLRKNKTIDWQKKESARANMRRIVKRLLKKYKYPPEDQEDALKTVISQCEMWTDNLTDFEEDRNTYDFSNAEYDLMAAENSSPYGK